MECPLRLPSPRTCGASFATEDFTSEDEVIAGQSMSLTDAISGAQIRAARILLGWSQAQLSLRCGVSEHSIVGIEGGSLRARGNTRAKIAVALIGSGIDFIESVGVRLWPQSQTET
jgi:DNA-binding XRE family transcriptional regulator